MSVLLLLALIPTVLHTYIGLRQDDGRRVASLPLPLESLTEQPGAQVRSASWSERKFSTRDWQERTFVTPQGTVRLSLARTYDAKRVYHHPELSVSYGIDLPLKSVEHLAAMPDVPVHVLRASPGGPDKVVLYALHYGEGFVNDPLWFQFRLASRLLVGGRQPMTLFFVTADDPGAPAIDGTWAARVLQGAIERFIALPAHDRRRPIE